MSKLTIGLTGGIGSGKTAASDWFKQQGINVIDADVEARNVVAKGSLILKTIENVFGTWAINTSGELNRQALREYIFNHPHARKQLETITHPAIRDNIQRKLVQSNTAFSILVAPLLFEGGKNGLLNFCHRTLIIDVPTALQKERAAQRDTQTLEQIAQIIKTQMPREEKLILADDVVDNSKDLLYLHAQLKTLFKKYMQLSQSHNH